MEAGMEKAPHLKACLLDMRGLQLDQVLLLLDSYGIHILKRANDSLKHNKHKSKRMSRENMR